MTGGFTLSNAFSFHITTYSSQISTYHDCYHAGLGETCMSILHHQVHLRRHELSEEKRKARPGVEPGTSSIHEASLQHTIPATRCAMTTPTPVTLTRTTVNPMPSGVARLPSQLCSCSSPCTYDCSTLTTSGPSYVRSLFVGRQKLGMKCRPAYVSRREA